MPIAPLKFTAQRWCTSTHGNSIKKLLKICMPPHLERYVRTHNVNTANELRANCWETRYGVKWRSSEGKLVLKITDDVTVRSSLSLSLCHTQLSTFLPLFLPLTCRTKYQTVSEI
jgi:hypothetical protein